MSAVLPLKERIRQELVEPRYYNDIKYNIQSKSRWKKVGDIMEAFAYALLGISGILAYTAGFSDFIWISYVAGITNTFALILMRYSIYSFKESKERTRQVNKILRKLGIDGIVDEIDNTTDTPNEEDNTTDIIMDV